MRYKKTLLFIFISTFAITGFSQTRKQYIKAADLAVEEQNYYAALKYYEEALMFDSSQMDIWFKYGESARKFKAFSLAKKAYHTVETGDTSKIYPLINLRYGQVEQFLGNYASAIGYFQKYLSLNENPPADLKMIAVKGLEDCEWAVEVVSNPDENIEIVKMGEEVNTPFSEFGAIVYHDTLYYTSFSFVNEEDKHDPPRHMNKMLFSVEGSDGEFWSNINSANMHTAHTAFNNDGSRVYFTYCDYVTEAEIRCDLYYRSKNAMGEWDKPVKMNRNINAPGYSTSEPQVAVMDEMGTEWLFFASDRPGGMGGMDLWYSIISDSTYSKPVNLKMLNTAGDDITPFFHTPSQTLFFSSNGRKTLGGQDIFSSIRTDEGFSDPEHTGFPLNSSYDDYHYKLSPGGAYAHFSSNRLGSTYLEKEKEACCHDIYQKQTLHIELKVLTFDAWTEKALNGATVTLQKLDMTNPQTKTNEDGNEFDFLPKRGAPYLITAIRDGYKPYRDTIYLDRPPLDDVLAFTHEIYMEPAEIDLKVFTFDDYSKKGLIGATVKVFELGDNGENILVAENTNENGNDSYFSILPGKTYIILGNKSGYENDIDTIQPIDPALGGKRAVEVELYLKPLIFAKFLPLTLYFDNDQPNPKSRKTTTDKQYLDLWKDYYARKDTFVNEFSSGMSREKKFLADQRLEGFFEREVKGGGEAFETFSRLLYQFLQQGNSLEIVLRGYASPRASDEYNDKISKRRIVSVKNHFTKFNGGMFATYLDKGTLKIIERPYGEGKAKADVSDKLNDLRNSVFGVPASLERRVEIIDVKQADDLD